MGFIETSYSNSPNLSQVNIDSNLNLGTFGITTDGELNINDSDLIGVKRFICQDFLSALLTAESDTEQDILILDNIGGGYGTKYTAKKFRIPSNLVVGSKIRVKYFAECTTSAARTNGIYQYDPETETKTIITSHSTPANTSEWVAEDITVNAGEIFGLYCMDTGNFVKGESGVKMCYDSFVQSGAVWEVITP